MPLHPDQSPSRRTVLAGLSATAVAIGLTPLGAGTASAAGDDFEHAAFNGLASYVLPGNDIYSKQQKRTRPGPGGVAAAAADTMKGTYDKALQLAVAPSLGVTLPGASGFASVLAVFAIGRYAIESIGPLSHPFANLTYARKGLVLKDLDQQTLLQETPLGYAFGTFVTLAALASYAEGDAFDGERLTGTPVAWELSRYGGVSDGWPEYHGYWAGNRAVRDED